MLIIAGRGVRLAGAVEELKKFAKTNSVVTTILGKDLVYRLRSRGTIGIKGNANHLIKEFDEIVFLGCSMPIAQLGYDLSIWKGKKVLSVNVEKPSMLIKCRWVNKDIKKWLQERIG